MKSYEILAPSGNMKDVKLMVREGADAIYVGLEGYSSRPNSADFTLEQIQEAVTFCHEHGVLYILRSTPMLGRIRWIH